MINAGETIIANSTIYENDGDGAVNRSRRLTVINSTIVGSGDDGVEAGENTVMTRVFNSIVADSGDRDVEHNAQPSRLRVHGSNLVADGSVVRSDVINEDPMLGPLADNGGPTRTAALTPGSPAIDAGRASGAVYVSRDRLDFDQRGEGFPRVVGERVDLGAYEAPASEGAEAPAGSGKAIAAWDAVLAAWSTDLGDDEEEV